MRITSRSRDDLFKKRVLESCGLAVSYASNGALVKITKFFL